MDACVHIVTLSTLSYKHTMLGLGRPANLGVRVGWGGVH